MPYVVQIWLHGRQSVNYGELSELDKRLHGVLPLMIAHLLVNALLNECI